MSDNPNLVSLSPPRQCVKLQQCGLIVVELAQPAVASRIDDGALDGLVDVEKGGFKRQARR